MRQYAWQLNLKGESLSCIKTKVQMTDIVITTGFRKADLLFKILS